MWCSPYYHGIELGDLPQQQVLVPMCVSCACCVLSVKSMVYETSVLDAEEGIRFRNYTIPECQVPHHFPAATRDGIAPIGPHAFLGTRTRALHAPA